MPHRQFSIYAGTLSISWRGLFPSLSLDTIHVLTQKRGLAGEPILSREGSLPIDGNPKGRQDLIMGGFFQEKEPFWLSLLGLWCSRRAHRQGLLHPRHPMLFELSDPLLPPRSAYRKENRRLHPSFLPASQTLVPLLAVA